jgi:ribonuclease D
MSKNAPVEIFQGDIGEKFFEEVLRLGEVAWDIETTGLDWQNDKIGTCQLYNPDVGAALVKLHEYVPPRLCELLSRGSLLKIFHHAPFDLRFMSCQWRVGPVNVACTKIAAKIVMPGLEGAEYSLKPLLLRELGVVIDKSQRRSNWLAESLSDEQIMYAVGDVAYLIPLLRRLRDKASDVGVLSILNASFDYLPVRVKLDILDVGDVFSY